MKRSNSFNLNIKRAAAVVLIAAIAVVSCGCSYVSKLFGADEIKFSRRSLSLYVGDTYDVSELVQTDVDYSVSSSNSTVVEVDGTLLKAKAVGTVEITAQTDNDSAKLKVTVTEREKDSLTISAEGELIQTTDSTSKVTLTLNATGAPAKAEYAVWSVNGEPFGHFDMVTPFEFTPDRAGEFAITVTCGELVSEPVTVRVFDRVTATVDVSGDLEQQDAFTDIVFTVTTDSDQKNYYQFYDNDRLLYEGELGTYTYRPTAGKHTLTVKVNGNVEYTGEGIFRGAIAPVLSALEYDDLYPHVYLKYDAVGKVKAEITIGDDVREYSQNDSRYAALFGKNGFDVGDIIELCAADGNRRTYKFRMKSLGDGETITESDYSDYFTFIQLPSEAKKYVETSLPCGDLYVTSDSEYVAIVEYYVYFRDKKPNAQVSFDCYIGYDRKGSAKDLWNDAFPIAATSGEYTGIVVKDSGRVMQTSFKVSSVNDPSKQTDGTARAAQLHAILPHINYDRDKFRAQNHVFPIDRLTQTVDVKYSDELYLAAQNGVKPVPESGSSAQTVYVKARNILREICTDDMSDVQKAHAIYDWIMWRVTYDTPATKISKGSESYSAYYMEGVFADGDTEIGGVVYDPYAVCDGMSKAYSLMCNIEGIPCVRVVGRAGKSMAEAGGHAWNKVYVDGGWYAVDCTWGDSHTTFALDGGAREYELGSHSHLFLTDAQINGTHFEPYRYGSTSIMYAPQTASTPINVYKQMTVNGVAIDCYIAKNENQQDRFRDIAGQFAAAYKKNNRITVPDGIGGGEYAVQYQAIEVYAENGFTVSDSAILSTVTAAIRRVHSRATVKVLPMDESVLIMLKA